MYNKPNTPQLAASFGSVQETFRYRLKNFGSGEQFSITEDMPKSKPIRFESKTMKGRNGDFESKTFLIRVISRGIEADIEIYEKELPKLAILCPKGTENFKGSTFVFDGYNWAYMGVEAIQTPQRDPRQPDLNGPTQPDQRDLFLAKLVLSIQTLGEYGNKMDAAAVMSICEKITPGKALDLFQYGKVKGAFHEENGVYKVS